MDTKALDVAILGGGLAGNLLARQLVRADRSLRVALIEKRTETSFKVGEATVEATANYLLRKLGLSSYLYDRHLPKNGLRFFFDTPAKDAELDAMTEIGTEALPFHPSFQLDRARLEADLLEMNAADGVQVLHGVRARNLELRSGTEPHRFTLCDGDKETDHTARWVVDATGRPGLIATRLGLRTQVTDHSAAAVWGRFRGVTDIDQWGPEAFRARVRYTSRKLSTIHFCYEGYWVWFIPLHDDVTSVGIVCDADHWDPALHRAEAFTAFLRNHRAMGTLLANAELIDHGTFGHLAYGTQRFFSTDRWGLTGESGAFTDPFYSPGTDFIALENDFLTDLITRDKCGEDEAQLADRVELYDRYMGLRVEANSLLYRDLYRVLGSYELLKLKWDLDIALYYKLWVSSYMLDEHLDLDKVRAELRRRPFVLKALENFSQLFRDVHDHLVRNGTYHRHNLGHVVRGLDFVDFIDEVGHERTPDSVTADLVAMFDRIRLRAFALMDRTAVVGTGSGPTLTDFLTGRAFA